MLFVFFLESSTGRWQRVSVVKYLTLKLFCLYAPPPHHSSLRLSLPILSTHTLATAAFLSAAPHLSTVKFSSALAMRVTLLPYTTQLYRPALLFCLTCVLRAFSLSLSLVAYIVHTTTTRDRWPSRTFSCCNLIVLILLAFSITSAFAL